MIKKLAGSIREYKTPSILAPLFVIGETFIEVMIPYLMKLMIDNGFSAEDLGYVIKIGLIMLICAAIGLICGVLSGRFAAIASTGLAKNLRQDMYYHIQEFSFENIDHFSNASLVTRLTTDITNVQNAYQMIIRMLIRAPIMSIFSVIMAFIINAQLSWVFVAAIPVLGFSLYFLMGHAHVFFIRLFKVYDRLNTVVQENLIGIRTVKAYVREEQETEKFKEASDGILYNSVGAEKLLVLTNPIMFFMVYLCTIVVAWLGANMIVSETMTTGDMLSLITYSVQILTSLMMVSMVIVQCVMAKASGDRIVEVLDEKSSLSNCENPVKEVRDGSVSFENVSFGYGKNTGKYVLKDVNIDIPSGAVVGVIGGTGSSKSSLIQLIPRLYDTSKGVVKVGGVDVRDYDIETLRSKVAMVLQKNELFSGTIASNLRWGNEDATIEDLDRVCELSQAKEFIDGLDDGYETRIEQGGRNVSGGQKQRLCIARALLKDPKILILDDSTSAVDMATDAKIRKGFREYIPEVTKIIVAQRIASVMDADIIIVLNEGEVVGIGDHDELYATNPIYREVYESQTKGGGIDE